MLPMRRVGMTGPSRDAICVRPCASVQDRFRFARIGAAARHSGADTGHQRARDHAIAQVRQGMTNGTLRADIAPNPPFPNARKRSSTAPALRARSERGDGNARGRVPCSPPLRRHVTEPGLRDTGRRGAARSRSTPSFVTLCRSGFRLRTPVTYPSAFSDPD